MLRKLRGKKGKKGKGVRAFVHGGEGKGGEEPFVQKSSPNSRNHVNTPGQKKKGGNQYLDCHGKVWRKKRGKLKYSLRKRYID